MIDCTKGIADLTVTEAFRCLVEAPNWKIIAHNAEQAWSAITAASLEQWLTPIVMFGLVVPGIFVSWVLPLSTVWQLFRRIGLRNRATTGLPTEGLPSWSQGSAEAMLYPSDLRHKIGWAIYITLSGATVILVGLTGIQHDPFMLVQGGWQIICGMMVYWLPLAWWAGYDITETGAASDSSGLPEVIRGLVDLIGWPDS